MRKTFMGVRLRSLRAERGLTQAALAEQLEISPSYLNQLEHNQRPLTVAVLLKISRALGVDVQQFSQDQEARLVVALRDALADRPAGEAIDLPDLQTVAAQMPKLARAVLALHQRATDAQSRLQTLALQLGDGRSDALHTRPMPFEAVRDFFFAHQNYFDGLDRAAEALAAQARAHGGALPTWLTERLLHAHGVRTLLAPPDDAQRLRHFDPDQRVLHLAATLAPGQQAFQLATQLALLELQAPIEALVAGAGLDDAAAQQLARIGLANYVAGALLLPYTAFLQAAEALRYDIDLLAQRFGVGFETVCHRLSTLQRAQAQGVPFFFVRVDRAGNISKRQSATHFHFSKTGGTCPLWNVYEAFAQPDRVLPQLAAMPDGRRYLWIARAVAHRPGGWGTPGKVFAIGLGCDVRHAHRLVYATGLDWKDPDAATPIGMGCKVCERPACPQRAFPFVGRALAVHANESRFAPYAGADSASDAVR